MVLSKNFNEGRTIDYVPPADLPAGTAVKLDSMMGVATADIKAGRKGALDVSGCFLFDTSGFSGPFGQGVECDFIFASQVVVVAGGGDSVVQVWSAQDVPSGNSRKAFFINKKGG